MLLLKHNHFAGIIVSRLVEGFAGVNKRFEHISCNGKRSWSSKFWFLSVKQRFDHPWYCPRSYRGNICPLLLKEKRRGNWKDGVAALDFCVQQTSRYFDPLELCLHTIWFFYKDFTAMPLFCLFRSDICSFNGFHLYRCNETNRRKNCSILNYTRWNP